MTWRGRQPALRNVSTTLLADRASVIVLRQAIDFISTIAVRIHRGLLSYVQQSAFAA